MMVLLRIPMSLHPHPHPNRKKGKGKGKEAEAKEVTVSVKKMDDANLQGGLSTMRREMLLGMRKEQEEAWIDYDFCADDSIESHDALQSLLVNTDTKLVCESTPLDVLTFQSSQSTPQAS